MRIIDVRERVVPIESAIRNAVISFEHMTVSLVAVVTDEQRDGRRVIGYGFNSNGRYAQSGLLRERFIPRLLAAPPEDLLDESGTNLDPARAWGALMRDEKPGGHGDRSVAVGILDMALWDVVAKIEGRPLAAALADRFADRPALASVPVYAAGGYYYPGAGIEELRDEVRRYLDLGYTTVKIKIGGASLAHDLDRIEAVIALLPGAEHLAVDANGRFDAAEAIEYARALEPYGLRWYEEPVDPLDYGTLAQVAGTYAGPLATGENLFAAVEVRNLIRFGGLRADRDVLQMDPALAYGLVEYVRMLAVLESAGWSRNRCIPHGGHQMNLAVAAGLGLGAIESYPEHFQPIGGFADDLPVSDGKAILSELPGIGIEAKARLYELASELVRDVTSTMRPGPSQVVPTARGKAVRIAGIVLKWIRGDKEANFRRIVPLIRQAAAGGAEIVVTTEGFLEGYAIADKGMSLETYRALGEPIPAGRYVRELARLADELDITLVAGMLEAEGEHRYNTAALLGPEGQLVGTYRKQKLDHESDRNAAGTLSSVHTLPAGNVGVMICSDRTDAALVGRFSENGAAFLLCPSGGLFGPDVNDPIVQARSRETGKYIVFVHPAEFLVTGPDGSLVRRELLGDRVLIAPDEIGTEADSHGVFFFDLPVSTR